MVLRFVGTGTGIALFDNIARDSASRPMVNFDLSVVVQVCEVAFSGGSIEDWHNCWWISFSKCSRPDRAGSTAAYRFTVDHQV